MRNWLVALLAWFCDVVDALPASAWRYPFVRAAYAASKRKIAAGLRRDVRRLRIWLFSRANDAFRPTTARQPLHQFTRGTRAGVRASKSRARCIWRLATAGIVAGMHRGALRTRIARLRDMLDNAAPLVARVLKRLHAIWRNPHGQGLVLVFAFDACECQAAPLARAPDSS